MRRRAGAGFALPTVEPDLRKGWAAGDQNQEEEWPAARGYVQFGYGEGQRDAGGEGRR
jgi:hypothetical protein